MRVGGYLKKWNGRGMFGNKLVLEIGSFKQILTIGRKILATHMGREEFSPKRGP
jgi:hypothetical protein